VLGTVGESLSFPVKFVVERRESGTKSQAGPDALADGACIFRDSMPDLSYRFIVPHHRPFG
jgi:hypothetical protein